MADLGDSGFYEAIRPSVAKSQCAGHRHRCTGSWPLPGIVDSSIVSSFGSNDPSAETSRQVTARMD